jgi:translation initiation factor IF-3
LGKFKKSDRSFVNHEIRAKNVRCIDKDNKNIGIISKIAAIRLAEKDGLDLVQVSGKGDTPTCKIIDYGKYQYEQSKKQKLAAKKQRESSTKTKEIKFRPCTGINDLKIKAKKAATFLNDGCKIKVSVVFKGRERAHQGVAQDTLNTFIDLIVENGLDTGYNVRADNSLSFDHKSINVMLMKEQKVKRLDKAS